MHRPPRSARLATGATSRAAALIHEFLDLGLPRDLLPARTEVIAWLEAWMRVLPEVDGDPARALERLFHDSKRDHARHPRDALQPYVLRLFVRWLAHRGDLSPAAADRLTLGLAPYCDARRFFPGGSARADRESSAPETPLSCPLCRVSV